MYARKRSQMSTILFKDAKMSHATQLQDKFWDHFIRQEGLSDGSKKMVGAM